MTRLETSAVAGQVVPIPGEQNRAGPDGDLRQRAAKLFNTTAFRLALGYLLALMITAAVVIWLIFWQTSDLLTSQVLQTIASEVKGLREQYRVGGQPLLVETVAARSSGQGEGLYLLLGPDGKKIAGNLMKLPVELDTAASGASFSYVPAGAPQSKRLALGVSLRVPSDLRLVVGRDVEEQRAFIDRTRFLLFLGFGVVTLVGIGAAYLVGRNILRRIDAVTLASRTIMSGDLEQRLPLNGSGDELDRLSGSLNDMLERIEQLLNSMREVSDNIAHDLRTPLTRIRNSVEAALREGDGATTHRAALEKTLVEADDLIRTFNALLSIARLEAASTNAGACELEISQIVSDVAELYEPVFDDAGIEFTVPDLASGHFRGDRQLIGQAIANLLDNAIKYAPARPKPSDGSLHEQTHVTLSTHRDPNWVGVGVADNGPGIPKVDRARALKRFVRLEDSRTLPGTGLGLSLVAAVARLHGGRVRLDDNEPGLKVILEFPVVTVG